MSAVGDGGKIGVVIVEDEGLFRDLLRLVLVQQPSLEVIGAFADAQSALESIPSLAPHVAILDIQLGPGLNGIQIGLLLRRQMPQLGVVLLSNHDDPTYLTAIPNDVIKGWSFLLKRSVRNVDALVRAIRGAADGMMVVDQAIAEGRSAQQGGVLAALTSRRLEILGLMAQGLSNAAIAERLVVSEKTVENHINAVYQQLDLGSEGSAVHARVKAVVMYLLETRR